MVNLPSNKALQTTLESTAAAFKRVQPWRQYTPWAEPSSTS
jgi:hypothetical protein